MTVRSIALHEHDRNRGHRHRWIGLDIGGANIKTAHEDGQARTVPFEVWKRPDELGRAIAAAAAALPASDRAAVTMTAELCDCYPTKAVGSTRCSTPWSRASRAVRSSSGALTASFTRWPRLDGSRTWPPRRTGWRWRTWRPG